jgi:hypothetical protein
MRTEGIVAGRERVSMFGACGRGAYNSVSAFGSGLSGILAV